MKINDFKENKETNKEVMKNKLEDLKLEKIRSLWYFISANAKVIVPSCFSIPTQDFPKLDFPHPLFPNI